MIRFSLASICVLATLSQVNAAESDPLFQQDEILAIEMTAPFETIDRERDRDKEYEGKLSYTGNDGSLVELDIKLEVRGNFRLRKDICRYSQLWVNVRTGQAEGTLFENQDRIKLVVQCQNHERYADYIAKEKQAYDIFNLVSDKSLRTRLVNVTYQDSEDPDEKRTQMAMFIEHHKRLANRLDMEVVEDTSVTISSLDAYQANLVAVFMYLIGNTDFSVREGPADDECCHNAKLLTDESGINYAVPYDFDGSGYVDTSYAADPPPQLNIRNHRQRLYRGYCAHSENIEIALDSFREQSNSITNIAGDTGMVAERSARRNSDFVEDFYAIVNDSRDTQRRIIEACRG